MITRIIHFLRQLLRGRARSAACPVSAPPDLPKPLRPLVDKYFEEHPDAKDGVMKAWYAYHAPHFRLMPELPLHNFTSGARESRCVWCGRSRELVRHDDSPAPCGQRPVMPEIKDVLRDEEELAFALADRAKSDVPKILAKLGMSGETLAILHHTYGHDPETVATVVDVPPTMMAGYHAAMEAERLRSRAAHVKDVVSVNTTRKLCE